ncbi:GGDEF domain-containing protein [Deinococcus radiotolerans]|uniref:GGDEF domain-containing protein n=1 Tax=Deinococcus radiotolerans TaxID=1309407 RepID=A0ABQ2FIY1_9DEIO|nr:GGDEF domain-containing protein [Deinococcus radiotolerans]GGK96649.1 hypothetical protein GCM10010844_13810 [Deinococcus radiotolerans]
MPNRLAPHRDAVKFWVLLMFFTGGLVLSVVGLLLPAGTGFAPAAGWALLLGNAAGSVLALGLLGASRRGLPLSRVDLVFLLLAQACSLGGTLGETWRFGTQFSSMTQLWVTVFAAGFLPRRLVWVQQVVGVVCITLVVRAGAQYSGHAPYLWLVEVLVTVLPVLLTGVAVAYFRGVAEREAQALVLAGRTDPLTGLGNRRALFDLFGAPRPLEAGFTGLVMLDLDHFKAVNDRYGHAGGDRVLQVLAEVLRAQAAPGDLLTRHGGEEFVWVTAAPDEQTLLARVDAARQAFSRRPDALGVTVSAGVALASSRAPDPLPTLLRRADEALYAAKSAGRDQTRLAS